MMNRATHRRIRGFAAAAAFALILAACGTDGDDITTTDLEDPNDVQVDVDVGTEDPPTTDTAPDVADGNAEENPEGEDAAPVGGQSSDQENEMVAAGGEQPDDAAAPPSTESSSSAGGTGTGSEAGSAGSDGDGDGDGDGTGSGGSGNNRDETERTEESDEPGADGDDASNDGDITNDPAAEGRVDKGFPATPVTDISTGSEVALADQLQAGDDNVLLWFWEPGSGASAAEADVVQRLADQDLDGVEIVAIGIGGDEESANKFPSESGLSGVTIVWDGTTQNAEQYQITTLPSAVLLDSGGDIIGRWTTLSPEVFQLISLLST